MTKYDRLWLWLKYGNKHAAHRFQAYTHFNIQGENNIIIACNGDHIEWAERQAKFVGEGGDGKQKIIFLWPDVSHFYLVFLYLAYFMFNIKN